MEHILLYHELETRNQKPETYLISKQVQNDQQKLIIEIDRDLGTYRIWDSEIKNKAIIVLHLNISCVHIFRHFSQRDLFLYYI